MNIRWWIFRLDLDLWNLWMKLQHLPTLNCAKSVKTSFTRKMELNRAKNDKLIFMMIVWWFDWVRSTPVWSGHFSVWFIGYHIRCVYIICRFDGVQKPRNTKHSLWNARSKRSAMNSLATHALKRPTCKMHRKINNEIPKIEMLVTVTKHQLQKPLVISNCVTWALSPIQIHLVHISYGVQRTQQIIVSYYYSEFFVPGFAITFILSDRSLVRSFVRSSVFINQHRVANNANQMKWARFCRPETFWYSFDIGSKCWVKK